MGISSFRGWPLALSGALLLFLANGSMRINGVLFPAIMSQEDLGRGAASWPSSLSGAAIVFVSPATGFLSARFSPACLTAAGTIIFCLGILPCYFSTNIYILSIFFGVIKGCGMAMMATTVQSSIATAFRRNRTTAMGIANAGQSLAGLVMPILTEYFLATYDLKSTFLLLTGVTLHGLIGAAGFMSYKRVLNSEFNTMESPKNNCKVDEKSNIASICSDKSYGSVFPTSETKNPPHEGKTNVCQDVQSEEISSQLNTNEKANNETNTTGESSLDLVSSKSIHRQKNHMETEICIRTECIKNEKLLPVQENKQISFNKQTLRKIFSTKIFYLITFTHIITIYLSNTFSQVIVDYLVDKGIDSSSAVLMITITSFGEITGYLCLTWLTDGGYLSRSTQIAISLMFCSAVTLLCTFTNEYWLLMACSFILGLSQGSLLPVNLVQVADHFTRTEVPLAMSFVKGMNGLVTLTKAPLIGLFRDELGSYDYLFQLLGSILLLIALFWALESICERKRNKEYNY